MFEVVRSRKEQLPAHLDAHQYLPLFQFLEIYARRLIGHVMTVLVPFDGVVLLVRMSQSVAEKGALPVIE